MAAKARPEAKGPVERLHERIATRDRGWFFARIADRVAEQRVAKGLSQRELAELVVQGGINDVVQRRPVEEAAGNLEAMLDRGRAAGLALAVTDVLPWNNGDRRAAEAIDRLNALIRQLAESVGATLLPFHDTLVDPADQRRMRAGLTDDGDHPSIEGHRLLGEQAFRV